MYQGSHAVRIGVVGYFASSIEQTDSDAAGNEHPMHGEEPQYRPPERVVIAPLTGPMEAGEKTAPRRILTAPLL